MRLEGKAIQRTVLIVVVSVMLAACGSSDETVESDDTADAPSTTEVQESEPEESATTTTAEAAEQEQGSGSGDYSVIMVAGVDGVTGESNLEKLQSAGFDGFEIEGSDETGFTVFQSGLTESEAEELLQAIRDELYGGSDLPGLIGETNVWFGDS